MATPVLSASESPLPPSFLPPRNFSRALKAHDTITALEAYAPNSFSEPPPAAILADGILLIGDLNQRLAEGRDQYLNAFSTLARANGSPLSPLQAGALTVERLTSMADGVVEVAWRVPVRVGAPTLPVAPFKVALSGTSSYTLDAESGTFAAHRLSELRLDGRLAPRTH